MEGKMQQEKRGCEMTDERVILTMVQVEEQRVGMELGWARCDRRSEMLTVLPLQHGCERRATPSFFHSPVDIICASGDNMHKK